MEQKDNQLIPVRATHPGEILCEELKERKISQKEFAKIIDMSPSHLNDFIHGRRNMSEGLAKKLETALGIEADFWMRFHYRYLYNCRAIAERKRKSHPLSAVIQEAINSLGYTNEEVANLVGVNPKKIDEYTSGKAVPSLKVAGILCTVLSIAPSTMLGI